MRSWPATERTATEKDPFTTAVLKDGESLILDVASVFFSYFFPDFPVPRIVYAFIHRQQVFKQECRCRSGSEILDTSDVFYTV